MSVTKAKQKKRARSRGASASSAASPRWRQELRRQQLNPSAPSLDDGPVMMSKEQEFETPESYYVRLVDRLAKAKKGRLALGTLPGFNLSKPASIPGKWKSAIQKLPYLELDERANIIRFAGPEGRVQAWARATAIKAGAQQGMFTFTKVLMPSLSSDMLPPPPPTPTHHPTTPPPPTTTHTYTHTKRAPFHSSSAADMQATPDFDQSKYSITSGFGCVQMYLHRRVNWAARFAGGGCDSEFGTNGHAHPSRTCPCPCSLRRAQCTVSSFLQRRPVAERASVHVRVPFDARMSVTECINRRVLAHP